MKLEDIEDCDRQKVISLYKRADAVWKSDRLRVTHDPDPDFHEAAHALYTLATWGWQKTEPDCGVSKTMIPFSSLEELDLKLAAMGG